MPRELEFEFSESPDGAGQFLVTGSVVQNLRIHLTKGNMDQAVELYESCVENVGDILLEELKTASTQLQRSLANLFYRARDYKRAGIACERLGEWDAAARAHESSYAYDKAAAAYLKTGNPKKAAAMLEKAGQHARAAEIYYDQKDFAGAAGAMEAAGDCVGSAQIFLRLGDNRRAAQSLARVQPSDPKFGPAMSMLADVLIGMGRKDLAIQRLAGVLPRDGMIRDLSSADIAYKLGCLLQDSGDTQRAVRAFEMVRVHNPTYKDVAARVVQLQQGAPSLSGPIKVATGVPVAPAQGGTQPPRLGGIPGAISAIGPIPTPPPSTSFSLDPFAALDGNVFAPKGASGATHPAAQGLESSRGGPQYITRMDGYELLKRLPIFEDLSLDEMKDFYNLCEPVAYEPGALIIEQGKAGEALVIVREGSLRISKTDSGKEVTIATLPAGKYVGEMSLIDEAPTSARVTAAERVKAFRIRKEVFQTYLSTHDLVALRIYRSFTRTLVQRLRETNAKLAASG